MHRRTRFAIAAALITVVGSATVVAAQGNVPRAVQREVDRLFPGRSPEVVPERHDDEIVFEAITSTELEVVMDRRGEVREVEARIPRRLVPEAARDAAQERLGRGARITEAEVIVRGGDQLLYELEARVDGEERELYLTPQGRIVEDSGE